MGQLPKGKRLRRRSVLVGSSVAIAALAGCVDGVQIGGDDEPDSATSTDDSDDDDDGSDVDPDDAEAFGSEEEPEPDFIVGESDEADYRMLQLAYDALDSGDVIGLEPGEYTLQPEVDSSAIGEGEDLLKTYTYVAESPADTSLEFVFPEAQQFTVRGPLRFRPEDGPPSFWNLTLNIPEEVAFDRIQPYEDYLDDVLDDDIDDELVDAYPNSGVGLSNCVINGTVDGPVVAADTEFNDPVSHELWPTECRFYEDVRSGLLIASRCQFEKSLNGDAGFVQYSTIEGTLRMGAMSVFSCEANSGIYVTGDGRIEHSTVERLPDSRNAIQIQSEYDATISNSTINGAIGSTEDGSYVKRIERNVFDVPADTRYIIDGAPALEIYLNAFLGGDVRITTDTGDLQSFPSDDITLHHREYELGNYYSEWRGEEVDDDLLEPRTIPGDDGVMDRFPLADSDLEPYIERLEEAKEEDD